HAPLSAGTQRRSLHDALPIYAAWQAGSGGLPGWLTIDTGHLDLVGRWVVTKTYGEAAALVREHAQSLLEGPTELALEEMGLLLGDRKSTRLNSSHQISSYAVI